MTQNPHAAKAKDLLCWYIKVATEDSCDEQEVASIVDELIAAVKWEIEREDVK